MLMMSHWCLLFVHTVMRTGLVALTFRSKHIARNCDMTVRCGPHLNIGMSLINILLCVQNIIG